MSGEKEFDQSKDLHQTVLIRACQITGGEQALAEKLGLPLDETKEYLRGSRPVPPPAYMKAIDIVVEDSLRRALENPPDAPH